MGFISQACSHSSKDIDYPGTWSRYINNQNNSRYTAECDRLDNNSIKCSFNRLRVLHNETEINRLKKQLDDMQRKNNKEIQSLISELQKECTDLAKLNEGKNKKADHLRSDEPESFEAEFKKVCDEPTKDKLINFQRQMISQAEQTCAIYEKQYTSTFKYNSKTEKWISEEEPYGPCGVIAIEYFTKDAKDRWKYTLKQITTNKEGQVMGVKCSALADEEETSYSIGYNIGSGHYDPDSLMNCKYINLENLI